MSNRDAVIGCVEAAFADIPHAELLARLAEIGIPAGEVRTLDEVYDWEQTRSQGLLIDVDHPLLGTIEIPGPPLRFDDNAVAGGPQRAPPPAAARRAHRERAAAGSTSGTNGDRAGGQMPSRRTRPGPGAAPHVPVACGCSHTVVDAGSFVEWNDLATRPRRPWRGRTPPSSQARAAHRHRRVDPHR